jgi:hypothetical protein
VSPAGLLISGFFFGTKAAALAGGGHMKNFSAARILVCGTEKRFEK